MRDMDTEKLKPQMQWLYNYINIYVIFVIFLETMLNKNVADYTNFDGKTNKRIVQAPGGASSISLGWSDEKTDYGSQRHIKGLHKQKYSADVPQRPQAQPQRNSYMEHNAQYSSPYGYAAKQPSIYTPMSMGSERVGGEYGYKNYGSGDSYGGGYGGGYGVGYGYGSGSGSGSNYGYSYEQQYGAGRPNVLSYSGLSPSNNEYSNKLIHEQIDALNFGVKPYIKASYDSGSGSGTMNNNYGNNYGSMSSNNYAYNKSNSYDSPNYGKPDYSNPSPYAKSNNSHKRIQSLDIAMTEQYGNKQASIFKNEPPEYQYKPSVKINGPPKQNFFIGDADYNYWKDTDVDTRSNRKIQSDKRIPNNQNNPNERGPVERTSVKVHNPPGGKQTFTLG